jgi:hypothetical protein
VEKIALGFSFWKKIPVTLVHENNNEEKKEQGTQEVLQVCINITNCSIIN